LTGAHVFVKLASGLYRRGSSRVYGASVESLSYYRVCQLVGLSCCKHAANRKP